MEKHELIELIKNVFEKTGKVPQRRDFNSRIGHLFRKEFGSYSNAVKAAGFKPRRVEGATEEELLESLRAYYANHGVSPTTATVDNGLYGMKTYLRVLKCVGWSEVLKKAGLPVYIESRKGLPTNEDEIIAYARELIKNENIKSMKVLLRHPKFYGKDRIESIFGDARTFSEKVGMKYNECNVPFSVVAQKILDIANELGHTPSILELQSRGLSDLHIRKRFGTYNEVLKKIGLEPSRIKETYELTNEELIKIYIEVSWKNGFEYGCPHKQFKMLSGIGSDVLASRFGTINNLRKICGFKVKNARQIWNRDSVYSYLRELTVKAERKLTMNIVRTSQGGPSVSTIRRHLDKPFFMVAAEIWDGICNSKTK